MHFRSPKRYFASALYAPSKLPQFIIIPKVHFLAISIEGVRVLNRRDPTLINCGVHRCRIPETRRSDSFAQQRPLTLSKSYTLGLFNSKPTKESSRRRCCVSVFPEPKYFSPADIINLPGVTNATVKGLYFIITSSSLEITYIYIRLR